MLNHSIFATELPKCDKCRPFLPQHFHLLPFQISIMLHVHSESGHWHIDIDVMLTFNVWHPLKRYLTLPAPDCCTVRSTYDMKLASTTLVHKPLPSLLNVSMTELYRHSPTRPDPVVTCALKKFKCEFFKKITNKDDFGYDYFFCIYHGLFWN